MNIKYGSMLTPIMKAAKFIPGKTKILYGGVAFGNGERKAIEKVLDKNWWGVAEESAQFEKELASTIGVKRAIFVNSGSSALELGIRAAGLKKGSEIIVPACTFPTPIASIIREGLTPVVVDCEEGTNFIDPDSFVKSISKKTAAVLIVYVAGNVGNLDEILKIAKVQNLSVFEDNCDGFGGSWNGGMLGSFGTFSAISTHAAHIISTGQGGVVFTDQDSFADKIISLRDWGRIASFDKMGRFNGMPDEYHRYTYDKLGSNYNPLELQAAMGRVQLKKLSNFKKIRLRNWQILYQGLQNLKDQLILPKVYQEADPCWYTFTIVLKQQGLRKRLVKELEERQIEWRPILAGNIARQPGFKDQVLIRTPLPHVDDVFEKGFWLPVHPIWSPQAMEYIVKVIQNFFKKI